jgi:glutamate carboxypeptidase
MEATPRNAQLWGVAKVAGNTLGIELESMAAGGASDGNTTSLFTATLDGLGATGDGAHAVHEFVMIDKMLERTALLTLLLTADALDYKQ